MMFHLHNCNCANYVDRSTIDTYILLIIHVIHKFYVAFSFLNVR
jgi:hypothetical protein